MAEILFDKDKSYYLLVGVGKREKRENEREDSDSMAISADDALILKRALHAFDIFSDEKIAPLVNEKATSSEILEKLETLANLTQKEPADLVIIFFSGHGCRTGGKYYLICRNSTVKDLEKTAIDGNKFVEMLKAINCDKMLVLLDCCHAEGMGMTDEVIPFDKAAFKEYPNRVILTACEKTQLSYLSNPVSLFTYALIEGLGGKFLKGSDTEVNILNLAMDVRERVVALSGGIGKLQQPQFNVFKESGTKDFTLVRYPSGGFKEIKLLKEVAPALMKEGSKEVIDLNVESTQVEGYRNQFNWMVTNSISNQVSGDGSVNIKDSNGNIINIQPGISEDALKDIFQSNNKIIDGLISILKTKEDNESRGLLIKVQKIDVVSKFSEIVNNGIKNIIKTLLKKRSLLLEEIEKESGNTLISLKTSLYENTEKLKFYGIEVEELGISELKSMELK